MYTYDISLTCPVLLRMRNISDKNCRENQNSFYIQQNFSEYRSVYETTWKNMEQPEGPHMTL